MSSSFILYNPWMHENFDENFICKYHFCYFEKVAHGQFDVGLYAIIYAYYTLTYAYLLYYAYLLLYAYIIYASEQTFSVSYDCD